MESLTMEMGEFVTIKNSTPCVVCGKEVGLFGPKLCAQCFESGIIWAATQARRDAAVPRPPSLEELDAR